LNNLEKCINQHDKFWRQYALKTYGDCGEDFLQDCYIKLTRYDQEKLNQMITSGTIKFGMYVMLKQTSIDNFRKHSKTEVCSDTVTKKLSTAIDVSADIEGQIETDFKELRYAQEIESLPFFEREIFKKKYFERISVVNLSKQTNIDVRVLQSAIAKARNTLKKQLSNYGK